MKNDYVGGSGLGPYASHPQSSPNQRLSTARIANSDRSALSRTYNRNQEYSVPRRNNYLQPGGGQVISTINTVSPNEAAEPDKLTSFEPRAQVAPPTVSLPYPQPEKDNAYPANVSAPKRRLLPLRQLSIVVIAIAVLVVTGVMFKSSNSSPFSKQLTSSVNIKLYYPSAMPSGYHAVNSSIKITTSQSIFFEIADGKSIIQVDESQAEPANEIARVMQDNFKDTSKIKSTYGSALVGYQRDSPGTFGSLVSKDGSWIVATSNNNSKALSAVAMIVASLKPVQ